MLFSIGARITFLDFGSYRSELRNDVIVGSQYLADSEYYHPFTPTSNWFVAPRAGVNSVQENLYNENTLIASYRNRRHSAGSMWDMDLETRANFDLDMKAVINIFPRR